MKTLFNRRLSLAVCVMSVSCSTFSQEIEEIIVTSSLIDASAEAISNPLHIVDGQSIAADASQNIGATLDGLVGVSSSDYGAGVGQPIIRGMSGNRVKILNNGVVVRDVSGLGPDHGIDVDLSNIQQIEVVRGPSSLLYSNGTIGGIVNVVDNTIARKDVTEPEVKLGLEAQSVNNGDSQDFSYQNNLGGLNLSFAFKDAQFDNFDIPKGAVVHDQDEHEHEEEENLDYLPDSDLAASSSRLGISKTGTWGYFGISFNDRESLYGIPFHGEHSEEHEEERIVSATDSKVYNFEGSYILSNSRLKQVNYHFRDSDYMLTEQHVEEEDHQPEESPAHHEEAPTVFSNKATEFGAIFDMSNAALSQKVAINFVDEQVAVLGEEAYINPTESTEVTLGYYLSKDFAPFHLDFGIRHDQVSRNGSISHHEEHELEPEHDHGAEHEGETEYFKRDLSNTSFALTLGREINEGLEVNFGIASVQRAPTAVELLMNGPHLATQRTEVGNINLNSERSNNIDLTLNYEKDGFYTSLTFFQNKVDNYIYLLDETEEDHAEHLDEEPHHGLILANYIQRDAEFDGYELELGQRFDLALGEITLSFATDSISGEFAGGGYIPRITPRRNLYQLTYSNEGLEAALTLKDVMAQGEIADSETGTDGFKMLNLNLSKTYEFNSGQDLTLSVFGKNLLDEVARNHSSFVKNQVPLAGRNLGIRASYSF